jgi:hypothetical protein
MHAKEVELEEKKRQDARKDTRKNILEEVRKEDKVGR